MKRNFDPQHIKQLWDRSADGTTFASKIIPKLTLVPEHADFPEATGNDSILLHYKASNDQREPFSNKIANGVLFALSDVCTNMIQAVNDTRRRPRLSVSLDLKLLSVNKARVNEDIYIVAKTDRIEGQMGNSHCYFYDKNRRLFAKASQNCFAIDVYN